MKTLKETLAGRHEVTIQTIAGFANRYLENTWEPVLQADREELERVFEESGDPAYGLYIVRFMKPIFEQITDAALQIFHSHTRFHIPHAPRVFAVEETDREGILRTICSPAARFIKEAGDTFQTEAPQWEYGVESGLRDYLQPRRGYIHGGYAADALSRWGRHGWELVSVVPHDSNLVALFKRPKK